MISIVIPVFNEENNIGKLLEHLFDNSSSKNISEILVVDGGSTDSSQQIIKKVISASSSGVERSQKKGLDWARPDNFSKLFKRNVTAFLCACRPSASAIVSMALPMF